MASETQLLALSTSELSTRAKSAGVAQSVIDKALDAPSYKQALVDILMGKITASKPVPRPVPRQSSVCGSNTATFVCAAPVLAVASAKAAGLAKTRVSELGDEDPTMLAQWKKSLLGKLGAKPSVAWKSQYLRLLEVSYTEEEVEKEKKEMEYSSAMKARSPSQKPGDKSPTVAARVSAAKAKATTELRANADKLAGEGYHGEAATIYTIAAKQDPSQSADLFELAAQAEDKHATTAAAPTAAAPAPVAAPAPAAPAPAPATVQAPALAPEKTAAPVLSQWTEPHLAPLLGTARANHAFKPECVMPWPHKPFITSQHCVC
jgi:hypothetical protein